MSRNVCFSRGPMLEPVTPSFSQRGFSICIQAIAASAPPRTWVST